MRTQPPSEPAVNVRQLVRIGMSKRQQTAMGRLDAEDCSGIIWLTRKTLARQGVELSDDYCKRACIALKQYYALSVFDPINMHAISEPLDPFWHAHILDTVRYGLLCQAIGGFMHHEPLDHEDHDKVEMVARVYGYTLQTLGMIFGPENLDREFYPLNPPSASMVCRHDLKTDLIGLYTGDVFPEAADLKALKQRYGHEAQSRQIIAALNAID